MHKRCLINLIYSILLLTLGSCNQIIEPERTINPSLTLWYNEPASAWTEALPVGNGRIGAMIYGNTASETIQFNEETLWSGQPHNYARPGAYKYLEQLRELLWEGKQEEAHELANNNFMSTPLGQMSYLPFGNVLLNFPGHHEATDYQRRLNLENAISSVTYKYDGARYRREIFTSAPAQALIIRLESSDNKGLNFTAGLNSPHDNYEVFVEDNEIILRGRPNNYHLEKDRFGHKYPSSMLRFEARLKIETDGGDLELFDDSIGVVNARNATLYLVAATSFVNYNDISANPEQRCIEFLNGLEGKPYQTIKEEHIRDYRNLFSRVSLELGTTEISGRPTDERLSSFMQDEDPNLVSLLYQYGRYLLISSSRPGTQPATLQGIWNDRLTPPWDSKYTININTEMNYWPAEMTNLSECAQPLFSMVEDISKTGRQTAKAHYNLNGWVTHHNTDLWRGTAPINNANHGIWPTGGAWLTQHLWWHYQY
ncbi:MAG TPA: glycoside hydrolase family 95 protein, partial [Mariniphaga sp.]|nr:glycoside hydrolase family 95 protein [Mariniphaga sp.]